MKLSEFDEATHHPNCMCPKPTVEKIQDTVSKRLDLLRSLVINYKKAKKEHLAFLNLNRPEKIKFVKQAFPDYCLICGKLTTFGFRVSLAIPAHACSRNCLTLILFNLGIA